MYRDRYILSRLAVLVGDCDVHMKEYNFGAVTSMLYAFFLYDFCDLYLELVKPVVGSGAPVSEGRHVAQVMAD